MLKWNVRSRPVRWSHPIRSWNARHSLIHNNEINYFSIWNASERCVKKYDANWMSIYMLLFVERCWSPPLCSWLLLRGSVSVVRVHVSQAHQAPTSSGKMSNISLVNANHDSWHVALQYCHSPPTATDARSFVFVCRSWAMHKSFMPFRRTASVKWANSIVFIIQSCMHSAKWHPNSSVGSRQVFFQSLIRRDRPYTSLTVI